MGFEPAADLDEVEVGGTLLVELSEPVCLVRLNEQDVRAIHNICTHQQQPLDEGSVEQDGTLVCAAHAARFNLTTGASVGVPEVASIPVYACKVENGLVLVDLTAPTNADSAP